MLQDGLALLEDARAVVAVLLGLEAKDLCRLSMADRRRRALDAGIADGVWCRLCEACWHTKSARYRLTPERTHFLATTSRGTAWREHYRHALHEGRRASLQPTELVTLSWAFNFTPQAGGRGLSSMQLVEFRPAEPGSARGVLLLAGYPPLPYELSEDGKVLDIANFPPHHVRRLDTWEWEITNENVTFVSCVSGEDVQYNQRGFLQLTLDDILGEAGGALSREDALALLQDGGMLPQHIGLIRLLHDLARSRQEQPEADLEQAQEELDDS
mmetsp:Transcript_52576/g.168541  ORF Transcript_52576/g.168541 Transcript_52576/m.168541 type:complete len:271 (-) Transcript_52576:214-1026(-)